MRFLSSSLKKRSRGSRVLIHVKIFNFQNLNDFLLYLNLEISLIWGRRPYRLLLWAEAPRGWRGWGWYSSRKQHIKATSMPHLFVRGWPLTHSVPKNRTPGSVSPEACLSLHRLSLNPVLRSDPQLGLYLDYTIPHVPYTYKIHTKW